MYSIMYTKYIECMSLKVVKTALYIEVTEQLRSMIAGGVLSPGTWIDEQKLAEQLGVSRTPFREAIRILASEFAKNRTAPWLLCHGIDGKRFR